MGIDCHEVVRINRARTLVLFVVCDNRVYSPFEPMLTRCSLMTLERGDRAGSWLSPG